MEFSCKFVLCGFYSTEVLSHRLVEVLQEFDSYVHFNLRNFIEVENFLKGLAWASVD